MSPGRSEGRAVAERPGGEPPITLSDGALAMVRNLLAGEADVASLALWVEVTGYRDGAYAYDVFFQAAEDAAPGDWAGLQGDVAIILPSESVPKLEGSVIDVLGEGPEESLTIRNPNRPAQGPASPPIKGPLPDLSGDVAERVTKVLEIQVNPSIAAHGGRADLVAIDEGAAYLRLSGGCAGCGMVSVTLRQGIEVAIRQSVPEIDRVVDVTDHAAGTNPYYEPAKK